MPASLSEFCSETTSLLRGTPARGSRCVSRLQSRTDGPRALPRGPDQCVHSLTLHGPPEKNIVLVPGVTTHSGNPRETPKVTLPWHSSSILPPQRPLNSPPPGAHRFALGPHYSAANSGCLSLGFQPPALPHTHVSQNLTSLLRVLHWLPKVPGCAECGPRNPL